MVTGIYMIRLQTEQNPEQPIGLRDVAIGRSQVMLDVFEQARRFARSSAVVLLQGESGTGKEVIARLIHTSSRRFNKPYVRVNCAALSPSLIESELFGHQRGAFTGATEQRIGRFEGAQDGTLLLDEISEIPLNLQVKLLRVLEEGEFQRVGDNQSYAVNARIIATSNRDLEQEVERGTFREDLYYRLNVLQLRVPSLRERPEDIPLLVKHFAQIFKKEGEVAIEGFDEEAMNLLCQYDWPGNVRQLRNETYRICVLAESKVVGRDDVGTLLTSRSAKKDVYDVFEMTLKDAEELLIKTTLRRFRGNKTEAARHLGVTARTLRNTMKMYREAAGDKSKLVASRTPDEVSSRMSAYSIRRAED
jgi:DNA-binding NtrC family response regulator